MEDGYSSYDFKIVFVRVMQIISFYIKKSH